VIHPRANHILLVDRESDQVNQLLQLLRENGYKVSHAVDEKDALLLCQTSSPDLLIVDVDESGKNKSFIREAQKHYATHSTPIIVTTDVADHRKRIEYMELGIDDLVVKPCYPEEVVARVGGLLQECKNPFQISKTVERGFVGNLGEMDLIDLIQTMELGGKSGIIHLSRGDKDGQVFVHKGRIVDAMAPDQQSPKRAFLHMLTWIDGSFYVVFQDVPVREPLTESNSMLFEEAAQLIEQWRAVTSDLPSLHTHLSAMSDKPAHALGEQKQQMLEVFKEPRTILQAIDLGDFDDIEGLKIIKDLLESGLLIEHQISEAREKRTAKPALTFNLNGSRRFKNRYSHIFSIFRRKSKQPGDSANYGEREIHSADENQHILQKKEIIKNRIRLTKAELLLIRQKLGS